MDGWVNVLACNDRINIFHVHLINMKVCIYCINMCMLCAHCKKLCACISHVNMRCKSGSECAHTCLYLNRDGCPFAQTK